MKRIKFKFFYSPYSNKPYSFWHHCEDSGHIRLKLAVIDNGRNKAKTFKEFLGHCKILSSIYRRKKLNKSSQRI